MHRLHAPLVTEKEIAAVVEFWKAQAEAEYIHHFLEAPKEEREAGSGGVAAESGEAGEGEDDPMYNDAVKLVVEFGKASTSLLQRRLRIGYVSSDLRDHAVGFARDPVRPRAVPRADVEKRSATRSLSWFGWPVGPL